MKNVLLKIQYDGSEFHGWQRQPELCTVQGELERVLSILCDREIKLTGTSRTDRGVHALGQIANFKDDFKIPVENIKRAANNLLNPAVQILEARQVPLEFHSRAYAINKTYRYEIVNEGYKNPLRRNFVYYVEKPLNVVYMRQAADFILGKHDFKCFQSAGGEEQENTVRCVNSLNIHESERNIAIEINGDGFLYNMVRIIVGTLVEVGTGKRDARELGYIIESKDRKNAGHTAPPQGLYLKEIFHRHIKS